VSDEKLWDESPTVLLLNIIFILTLSLY